MSVDSVTQYQQALSGRFDDWHPPAMAVILSAIIACGGDIGLLMLFQCTAGIIGLRMFVFEIISQIDEDGRMTDAARSWAATIMTVLFLIPISPFAFYVMTFWKDAWVMILLLWIGWIVPALRTSGGGSLAGARCEIWLARGVNRLGPAYPA